MSFPQKCDAYLFEELVDAFNAAVNQDHKQFKKHWDQVKQHLAGGANPLTTHHISIVMHSSDIGKTNNVQLSSAELMLMAAPVEQWKEVQALLIGHTAIDLQTQLPNLSLACSNSRWGVPHFPQRYDFVYKHISHLAGKCGGDEWRAAIGLNEILLINPWNGIEEMDIQDLAKISSDLRHNFNGIALENAAAQKESEIAAKVFQKLHDYSFRSNWKRAALWVSMQPDPYKLFTAQKREAVDDSEQLNAFLSLVELNNQTQKISAGKAEKIKKNKI